MNGRFPRRSLIQGAAVLAGAAVAHRLLTDRPVFGAAEKPRIKMGQIGTSHAHANKIEVYRRNASFEVIGVVEPDDKRWEAVKESAAYKDLPRLTEEQLLNSPGLELVGVETRVRDLVPTASRCIAADVHIHLDKPASGNLEDFRKLMDAADAKKRIVQLGYMLRHSPATILLKKLLKEGALGDIFEVTGVMSKVVSKGERKSLAEYSGGMMFELGCHVIDSLVGVLGKPDKIAAFPIASAEQGDGLKDNCLAVFQYPKATATIRSTGLEVDGGKRRQFVVCGTGGTFRVEPLESPVVRLSLAQDTGGFAKGTQDVPMPKYSRYVGDAIDLAATIHGEKPNDYSSSHDLLVHECVLRAGGML